MCVGDNFESGRLCGGSVYNEKMMRCWDLGPGEKIVPYSYAEWRLTQLRTFVARP